MFSPGEVLDEKYSIVHKLGEGGMGIVYLARHLALEQSVAIKVLLGRPSDLDRKRFLREARLAARMRGELIARVLDFSFSIDAPPYLVFEFLEGRTLAALIRRAGALPIATSVDYVLQTAVGVAEAHALGIVHRDLKPANLFLTTRIDGSPCVKVLDFGISKLRSEGWDESSVLTAPITLLGTPEFSAPEQLSSAASADERSDVWALGATLYQLMTGRLPFEASSLAELLAKVRFAKPLSPHEHRREIPKGLAAIVLHCLEAKPARRFGDVGDLALELANYASVGGRFLAERAARSLATPTAAANLENTRPDSELLEDAETLAVEGPTVTSAHAAHAAHAGVDSLARPLRAPESEPTLGVGGTLADADDPAGTLADANDAGDAFTPAREEDAFYDDGPDGYAAGYDGGDDADRREDARPRARQGWLFAVGISLALIIPGGALLAYRSGSAPEPVTTNHLPASETGPTLPPASGASPSPSGSPPTTPSPGSRLEAAAPVVSATGSSPRPPHRASTPYRAATTPRSPPTPTAPPATSTPTPTPPKSDCDPTYWVDESGRKHYKPQCFAN